MRWDYKRGAWRHVANSGKLMFLWYKQCGVCGRMEDYLGAGSVQCYECRKAQWERLDAIAGPAQRMVAKAVKDGLLPRLDGSIPCVDCGAPAAVYDHREYSKPLDVDPVCKKCNRRRGPAKETAPLVRTKRAFCGATESS